MRTVIRSQPFDPTIHLQRINVQTSAVFFAAIHDDPYLPRLWYTIIEKEVPEFKIVHIYCVRAYDNERMDEAHVLTFIAKIKQGPVIYFIFEGSSIPINIKLQ